MVMRSNGTMFELTLSEVQIKVIYNLKVNMNMKMMMKKNIN